MGVFGSDCLAEIIGGTVCRHAERGGRLNQKTVPALLGVRSRMYFYSAEASLIEAHFITLEVSRGIQR